MALNIIKPTESIPVDNIRVLFYGEPGAGKSSLGYTCKNPLVLDFDRGGHRTEFSSYGTTVRIDSWPDIMMLARETSNYAGYDTIVIDTISKCLDYLTAEIIRMNPKSGNGRGSLSMSGWGDLASAFKGWIHGLIVSGKDVVMIAQHVDEKDGDRIKKRPKAQGKQALALILEEADFLGYVHIIDGNRCIGFKPNEDYYGKDSARLGVVSIPDFHSNTKYSSELMYSMKDALRRITAEKSLIIEQVTVWHDTISGFTTAAEFNQVLPQIKDIPEGPVKQQVNSIVRSRRIDLNLGWDKENGVFTPPAPKPVTPVPQAQAPATAQVPAQAPPPVPAPAEPVDPQQASAEQPEPAQPASPVPPPAATPAPQANGVAELNF